MNDTLNQIVSIVPERYRPGALLLLAWSPFLGRAYHALANGKGIKGVFSAIWLGTNTPADQKTPPSNTGTRAAPIALMLAFSLAMITLAGCSTEQSVAYKTVTGTQITVEAAMTGYSDYLQTHTVDDATRAKVKAAYEKYQTAATLVIDAQVYLGTLTASNQPPVADTVLSAAKARQQNAVTQAGQALSELVALLQQIGVKF